jgi:hypothetical protein
MFEKVKYSISLRELFYSDLLMSSRNKIFMGRIHYTIFRQRQVYVQIRSKTHKNENIHDFLYSGEYDACDVTLSVFHTGQA